MRVAIDAGVLDTGRGGDETFMRNLLAGLVLAAGDGDRFVVYLDRDARVPSEVAGDPRFALRRMARLPSPIRYALDLPWRVARERPLPDLLLTTNHAPLVSVVPRVLLVHDLSFRHHPELYRASTRARLRWLVPLHVRQARAVVTVSEFSRRDLIDAYGLEPRRVHVIPNAVRARAASAAPLPAGVGARFFLYVGNLHPRKNVARLIAAFDRARRRSAVVAGHQLVIAGAAGWDTADVARAAAALPGLVLLLGRVSDDVRDTLVARATALAYVSLFEGFGLPPLEAMAAGTPVVASRTAAIPDVVGDAGILVEPTDVEDIANALVRVAEDGALRQVLVARGRERASSYDIRRTGDAAIAAFETAASTPAPVEFAS